MKQFIQIFTIVAFCLVGLTANAQKFGYINSQELIQEIPEVKEATSNLETFRQQLSKQAQDMLKRLETKYQELERKQANGEISPKELETEATLLKAEEGKLMEFEQSSQQKIYDKNESLLSPIREKIQKAIDDVRAEDGFTFIFDHSTGFVLYADSSADVTAKVKAKLGL